MSVEVTQTGTSPATLIDNTGGMAFGPVFESQTEAETFLEWLGMKSNSEQNLFDHGNETLVFLDDPRIYRSSELVHVYRIFKDEVESISPVEK